MGVTRTGNVTLLHSNPGVVSGLEYGVLGEGNQSMEIWHHGHCHAKRAEEIVGALKEVTESIDETALPVKNGGFLSVSSDDRHYTPAGEVERERVSCHDETLKMTRHRMEGERGWWGVGGPWKSCVPWILSASLCASLPQVDSSGAACVTCANPRRYRQKAALKWLCLSPQHRVTVSECALRECGEIGEFVRVRSDVEVAVFALSYQVTTVQWGKTC